MDMSERKLQILQAIILNYLETAEPVGSRTISRRFLMDLSSATIRNEMSDLEEMGLIEQPHTSAGRIPSSKGYRLYVDQLMKRDSVDDQQVGILMNLLKDKTLQLDFLLKEIGDLLATLTKYTTVVTMPHLKKSALKHLQLMPLDDHSAVLVLVTDGNIVRNHVIPLVRRLEPETMYHISDVLNKELSGLSVTQMDLTLIQKIKRECQVDSEVMESLLNAISDTLQHADDGDVFTSGATNILSFPEFSDIARARSLLEFLGQKDQILHLVNMEDKSTGPGLKIRIGTENQIEQLHDCSIVTANYRYGDRTIGTISVVGPMRMDYKKVVSALEGLMQDFPNLFVPGADPPQITQEDNHGKS